MSQSIFVRLQGSEYSNLLRIDKPIRRNSPTGHYAFQGPPATQDADEKYGKVIRHLCDAWKISRNKNDLALVSSADFIICNGEDWLSFWQYQDEQNRSFTTQTVSFTLVVRPLAPAIFLAQKTNKAETLSSPSNKMTSADKRESGATVQAGIATPAASSQASQGNNSADTTPQTAHQPEFLRTNDLSTSSTHSRGPLSPDLQREAISLTSAIRGLVSEVASVVQDVTKEALREARENVAQARNTTSGAEAAQTILTAFDRLRFNEGARGLFNPPASAFPQNSQASSAPTRAEPRSNAERHEVRTPSSSYDNTPPSEPLRETPIKAPASDAKEQGLKNAEAIRKLGSPVSSEAPASKDKGKGRETTSVPSDGSSDDWQITENVTPSAVDASEQGNVSAAQSTGSDVAAAQDAQKEERKPGQGQETIAASNDALEDAFNAMLARLREGSPS
ncbi:unnamed protein product [Sympodiomycopsis kandeliae]